MNTATAVCVGVSLGMLFLLVLPLLQDIWWWRVGSGPKRTHWVVCWNCRHDLNGDDKSYIREVGPYDFVWYRCAACGEHSVFDFGPPGGVLLQKTPWVSDESLPQRGPDIQS